MFFFVSPPNCPPPRGFSSSNAFPTSGRGKVGGGTGMPDGSEGRCVRGRGSTHGGAHGVNERCGCLGAPRRERLPRRAAPSPEANLVFFFFLIIFFFERARNGQHVISLVLEASRGLGPSPRRGRRARAPACVRRETCDGRVPSRRRTLASAPRQRLAPSLTSSVHSFIFPLLLRLLRLPGSFAAFPSPGVLAVVVVSSVLSSAFRTSTPRGRCSSSSSSSSPTPVPARARARPPPRPPASREAPRAGSPRRTSCTSSPTAWRRGR